jgi:hypothetical protein
MSGVLSTAALGDFDEHRWARKAQKCWIVWETRNRWFDSAGARMINLSELEILLTCWLGFFSVRSFSRILMVERLFLIFSYCTAPSAYMD